MSNEPLFRSDFVQVDEVDALTAEGKPYRHTRVTPRSRYGGRRECSALQSGGESPHGA